MVEKNENHDMTDLNTSMSRLSLGITHKNLENDIYKLFLRKEYQELKGSEKVRAVLINADNEIITWHRKVHGDKDIALLDYEHWKTKLLDYFKQELTATSFLQSKQKSNETILEFFKRMEIEGKQLKLKESLILDIIKNCLTRHSITIHEAIIGERKFTETLYEIKENQFEYIIKKHKNMIQDTTRKYVLGDLVFIKDEKIKIKGQPRFNKIGTIVEVGERDTYKVKIYGTSKKWQRHADQLRYMEPEGALIPREDVASI